MAITANKEQIKSLFNEVKHSHDGVFEQTKNGLIHYLSTVLSLNADSYDSLEDASRCSFSISEKLLFISVLSDNDVVEMFKDFNYILKLDIILN